MEAGAVAQGVLSSELARSGQPHGSLPEQQAWLQTVVMLLVGAAAAAVVLEASGQQVAEVEEPGAVRAPQTEEEAAAVLGVPRVLKAQKLLEVEAEEQQVLKPSM